MIVKGFLSAAWRVGIEGSTFLILIAFTVFHLFKVSSFINPCILFIEFLSIVSLALLTDVLYTSVFES